MKRIYRHEQFHYPHLNELDYDIALVKPVEDIVTNHFIHYACLPKRDSHLHPGHFCWVTGWGDTQGISGSMVLEIRFCKRVKGTSLLENVPVIYRIV